MIWHPSIPGEVRLPTYTKDLKSQFLSAVCSAQAGILWLSESDLDPDTVAAQGAYLIQDVAEVQGKVMQAMTFNKSSSLED